MRYALIYIIASQLVSLQDVFHLAVQFSKYIQLSLLRSLKTIQVQEEEQSFDQDFAWISLPLSAFALSSSSQLSLRSTWNE